MADVAEIKKQLNREQMNRFGAAHGVENAADEAAFPDKQSLAEAISPKVTPEDLAAFVQTEKDGGAPQPGEPLPADPATTPPAGETATPGGGADTRTDSEREADENAAANGQPVPKTDEAAQATLDDPANTPPADDAIDGDIEVGSYVYYPYAEAQSGFRRGRVTAFDEETVEVVWADGSRRSFSRGVVKLES